MVALLWLLSHPAGFIPLLGTTNNGHMSDQVTALSYIGQMTNDQWWSIAAAGGLCGLGDTQCNYDEYVVPLPEFNSTDDQMASASSDSDCSSKETASSSLGVTLIVISVLQSLCIAGLIFYVFKQNKKEDPLKMHLNL